MTLESNAFEFTGGGPAMECSNLGDCPPTGCSCFRHKKKDLEDDVFDRAKNDADQLPCSISPILKR